MQLHSCKKKERLQFEIQTKTIKWSNACQKCNHNDQTLLLRIKYGLAGYQRVNTERKRSLNGTA